MSFAAASSFGAASIVGAPSCGTASPRISFAGVTLGWSKGARTGCAESESSSAISRAIAATLAASGPRSFCSNSWSLLINSAAAVLGVSGEVGHAQSDSATALAAELLVGGLATRLAGSKLRVGGSAGFEAERSRLRRSRRSDRASRAPTAGEELADAGRDAVRKLLQGDGAREDERGRAVGRGRVPTRTGGVGAGDACRDDEHEPARDDAFDVAAGARFSRCCGRRGTDTAGDGMRRPKATV